jgi:hypothetical protein
MRENGRNKMPYSAEDIRKYLDGEMSSIEMHAIEKSAMEDPLLADAIEGLQEAKSVQQKFRLQTDSKELKRRLASRIRVTEKQHKPVFIRWWQVAAAVIILAASGSLLFKFLIKNSGPSQPIAETKLQALKADSSQFKADAAGATRSIDTITRKEESLAKVASKRKLNELNPSKKPNSIPEAEKQDKAKLDSEVADQSAPAPTQIGGSENKSVGMANRIRSSAQSNILEGKVIDANQRPIIGASVRLNNQQPASKTDSNGMFRISGPLSDKVVQATVTDAGYQPLSTPLKNNYLNVISLHPGPAYSNNLGFAPGQSNNINKKNFFSEATDSAESAHPIAGWDEFQQYLDKNKKITTADSAIKGLEIISFVVGKNGKLSSFLLMKSLSAAHDAEAIRLIKQGPSWINPKGKKMRMTISITF